MFDIKTECDAKKCSAFVCMYIGACLFVRLHVHALTQQTQPAYFRINAEHTVYDNCNLIWINQRKPKKKSVMSTACQISFSVRLEQSVGMRAVNSSWRSDWAYT